MALLSHAFNTGAEVLANWVSVVSLKRDENHQSQEAETARLMQSAHKLNEIEISHTADLCFSDSFSDVLFLLDCTNVRGPDLPPS